MADEIVDGTADAKTAGGTTDASTSFEPVTLPSGAVLSVRPSHVEVGYSDVPANAPRTEHGPQVVYTDANGEARTVDCESVSDAENLARTCADVAYLLAL